MAARQPSRAWSVRRDDGGRDVRRFGFCGADLGGYIGSMFPSFVHTIGSVSRSELLSRRSFLQTAVAGLAAVGSCRGADGLSLNERIVVGDMILKIIHKNDISQGTVAPTH